MTIAYVGGKGAGTAGRGGGSISLTTGLTGGLGGAPIAGDLVIVSVAVGSQARNPNISVLTPTGYSNYSQLNPTAATYDTSFVVAYKVMGSTPDTTVTIPASGNNADAIAYTIHVFRGTKVGDPIIEAVSAVGTGVTSCPNPASVTPSSIGGAGDSDTWIFVSGAGAAATGANFTASYLTNFLTFTGADTNDVTIGSGYYTDYTTGTYDPPAFGGCRVNAANSWASWTIALEPEYRNPTDTDGALAGAGATLSGSASRTGATVTHGATGDLAATGAALAASANRFLTHSSTGVLAGAGVLLSGTANRFRQMGSSGALAGAGAALAGTASRERIRSTSGALAGTGATLAGSASRVTPFVTHDTAGALTAAAGALAGTASRTRQHPSTGDLAGSGALLAGTSNRFRQMATSGTLVGTGAALVGEATRSGGATSHDASGDLAAAGASLIAEAVKLALHEVSGNLQATGATLAGDALLTPQPVLHDTSGALAGAGTRMTGGAINVSNNPAPAQHGGGGGGGGPALRRLTDNFDKTIKATIAQRAAAVEKALHVTPTPEPAPAPVAAPTPEPGESATEVEARRHRRQQEEFFIMSLLLG